MQSTLTSSRTAAFAAPSGARPQVRKIDIDKPFACHRLSSSFIASCLNIHISDLADSNQTLQARRSVAVYAAARPLWQPGSTPPAHLDGSLPGDFGFDPLNLGSNKAALDW